MKKVLSFIIVVLFLSNYVKSQDIIVKNDKTSIKTKVLEITDNEVKYKKFDNQTGPTYSLKKSEITNIVYENGDTEVFETSKASSSGKCEIELPQCGLIVACLDLEKEITWDQAMNAPDGWRLPTLIEFKCMCEFQKKIRLNRKDEYWTSTTKGNRAYSITLDDCEGEINSTSRTRAVRYVREM